MNNFIGDKKNSGGRKIKFFWSPERWKNENIYHCIASCCAWTILLITVVFIILCYIFNRDSNTMTPLMQSITLYCAIPLFVLFLTFLITKINERKIRKQRQLYIASNADREIVG